MNGISNRFQSLRKASTGLSFEALLKFSGPLWNFYEVRPEQTLADAIKGDQDSCEVAVSIMETARLFWAYFRGGEQPHGRAVVSAHLIGTDPDEEDAKLAGEVFSAMEKQFGSFSSTDIEAAEAVPGTETLDLQNLVAYFEAKDAEIDGPQFPDTDNADGAAVLAIFAEPLMETLDIENPEAMEQVMDKAGDYWQLAQSSPNERAEILELIKQTYAKTAAQRTQIEKEALQMVARYNELFSGK